MRHVVIYIALLLIPLAVNASDADTTKLKITRQWTLSSDYTTEIPVPIDTAFNLFHRYRLADKYSDFNAYMGNYGQPLYQINFFDREWQPDRFPVSYYIPFMHTPSNPLFINTQVPFTELVWSFGGSPDDSEQTFRIRHSQNVNRKLNFGFIYDIDYCLGQYKYQTAINKTFLFHSSYNGDRYTAYFTAGINNLYTDENGGINENASMEGTTFPNKDTEPGNVPFYLTTAKSTLRNRHLMIIQRFSPGLKADTTEDAQTKAGPVTFSHIGIYEWNKRRYIDGIPGSGFYDTIMINDEETADSLFQGMLTNTLRVDFAAGSTGRFRIGAGAGIRSELRHYAQIVPGDTLTRQDTMTLNQSSLVLTGRIFNNIGEKFGWWATGDLWFQGYRAGDFQVNGRIFKDFSTGKGPITWDATGTIANYTPSYWYSKWGSNNFSWDFEALKEFRTSIGSSVSYPGRHLSIRFNYAIIDNYIYMGADTLPEQHQGGLSVAALTVRKEFVLWKLHWDNSVLIQKSSNNDVLSLPLATGRSALFFDHTFRFKLTNGELAMQLGGEVFIHTPYNAMNYMPATGRYFNQNETETGNYPFINAFLNIKLKRTRVFLMYDHVNSNMTGFNYFLVPGYPMNIRMLRYGLAWTFYN